MWDLSTSWAKMTSCGWMGSLGGWICNFMALMIRHGMSHINVTDTGNIVREQYTTHSLHVNSTGKMRLTESIRGGVVPSGNSSTPVITHAIAPPFRLRWRAHMCLTCIKCSNLSSKGYGKLVDSLNSLNIFHQNIRRLRNKSDELMNTFVVNSISPHVLY